MSASVVSGDSPSVSGLTEALRQQWQEGTAPDLADVLSRAERLAADRASVLCRVDQEGRWKHGERVLAESYLGIASLKSDTDEQINLILHEYLVRQAIGDAPDPTEFLQRFPHFAEQLHNRLNASVIVERLYPSKSPKQRKPASAPLATTDQVPPDVPRSKRSGSRKHSLSDLQMDTDTAEASQPQGPANLPTVRIDELFPGILPSESESSFNGLTQSLDEMFPDEITGSLGAGEPSPSPSSQQTQESSIEQTSHRPASPRAPRQLPTMENYEILEELGRGGMGVVYKARDRRLKRMVALKMILGGEHAGERQRSRFHAEAEAVARLHHPNIVQIYEIGEERGHPYLALEYVAGRTLSSRLIGTPLPEREAVVLIATLARAIDFAHKAGVVHRDLKPGNVLLGKDGQPKITDFGLAKRIDDTNHSKSGDVIGTPSYMAPEQAWGKNEQVGATTDVYALGAMLYELLTGRPPFRGATPMETIEQIWTQDPVPPRQLQARLARDTETVCLKCLAKEPAKRYPSALALSEDLERFLKGDPILARPASWWEQGMKWSRRRPGVVATLGAGVAVLVGIFILTVWHNSDLQTRLDQARRAEQLATRDKHLAALREEVQILLSDGLTAYQEKRFSDAQVRFIGARAKVGTEESLADLRGRVDEWLEKVRPHLADQEAERKAQEKLTQFRRLHQEALFQATVFSGENLTPNRSASRSAAEKALALFGTPLNLPGTFTAAEMSDVRSACYELLLLLGETGVSPIGGAAAREALSSLDRASSLGLPDTRALHLRRARCYEVLGDPAAARKEFEVAESLLPRSAFEYFLLGDEHYRRGDLDRAILALDKALGQQSNHFPAQYLLAVCYLKEHRLTEAKVSLNACVTLRSDLIWVYLLRGHVHSELNDFESATKDFETALNRSTTEAERYGVFLHRGTMYLKQEKFAEAAADFGQAIKLQPEWYPAYVNQARAAQKQGNLEDATEYATEAIRRAPKVAALYRNRAYLLLERGKDSEALADFRRAIELEDGRGNTERLRAADQLECGRIYWRARQYQEAVNACDAALMIYPDHFDSCRLRGESLLELKQYPEAIHAFDTFLKRGGPDATVYTARGLAKAKLGNQQAAILDYSQALELKPEAHTYVLRGWAYVTSDLPKLALPDFEAAVKLNPKNDHALNGRGYVRVKLGQYQEGANDAEAALRLGSDSPGKLLTAARAFALGITQIDADEKILGKKRLELREQYQGRALQLVRQTMEKYPSNERAGFWDKYVRTEPDLKSLRKIPEFVELDKEYAPFRK